MKENNELQCRWYSKNKAITLITLIITIIVMLILAGVIINLVTDEDDVFDTAKEATGAWNNRITTEDNKMQNLLAKRNEILGGTVGGGNGGSGETPTEPGGTTIAVGSVSLNNTSLTINKGNTQQLTATITPNNATNKNVVWSSSDDNIATVDASGLVTAVNGGTATITVTTQDGGKTASCTVTVPSGIPTGWESSKVAEVVVEGTRKAPIPMGYTKSGITSTINAQSPEDTIAGGLVVYQIPEGATVNWANNQITLSGESTAKNLQENVNQYVWIPVDDINDMVMCKRNGSNKKIDGTTVTDGEKTTCELDYNITKPNEIVCKVHGYESSIALTDATIDTTGLAGRLYGTNSNTSTIPFTTNMEFTQASKDAHIFKANSTDEDSKYREPDLVTSKDNSNYQLVLKEGSSQALGSANALKHQLNNKFIEMAKSVAKYGGFYISRFEPSYEKSKVISKKNKAVLTAADSTSGNYIGGDKWYGLYNKTLNNVEKDASVNSHMIWGCQYDQVIKFLGIKAQTGHSYQTKKQVVTGYTDDQDILNNIYDLEGNNFEWIAQASSTSSRVYRGGNCTFASNSMSYSASHRTVGSVPTGTPSLYTTRPTLYVVL